MSFLKVQCRLLSSLQCNVFFKGTVCSFLQIQCSVVCFFKGTMRYVFLKIQYAVCLIFLKYNVKGFLSMLQYVVCFQRSSVGYLKARCLIISFYGHRLWFHPVRIRITSLIPGGKLLLK